jgi:hypothetical protein
MLALVTKVLSIISIDARSFNQDCWFVITFATAVKKKRHQSDADKQGENDAESHRDIARRWHVGISEGPTEIGDDASRDQEQRQHREHDPRTNAVST